VLETIGENDLEIDDPKRVVFPPLPEFDMTFVYASDGVVHHVTAEAINRATLTLARPRLSCHCACRSINSRSSSLIWRSISSCESSGESSAIASVKITMRRA
jgi:hypothetical protein